MKTLLALGAGGVFLSGISPFARDGGRVWAYMADTVAPFETFSAVSTFITLHDDLGDEALHRMYDVFKKEPWSAVHIDGLYGKISAAVKGGKQRPPLKDPSWQFTHGENWFAGHLLTTWYLGVYYHDKDKPQRILYEDALLFRPTKGIMPIPYVENVGYGAWVDPPPGEK